MTAILLLGMLIMAVLLQDSRRRLKALEQRLNDGTAFADNAVRTSPPSVDRTTEASGVPSPWSQPVRTAEMDEPATETGPEREYEPESTQPAVAQNTPSPAPTASATSAQTTDQAPVEAPSQMAGPSRLSFSFEDLFGRKLPIWAGGITLVVAAVLLVKYSIDAGLLSPAVRVVLGLLFGGLLIGGAELARRRADVVQDARISQALAGAGLGSLYASTVAAANLYALIGPATAFAALAGITALAMALALRFGAPSAMLGLIGGLATPAVIQSSAPNVPLLAGYIATVIGGLTLLSRRQRWMWLGIGALIGGAGWSLMMILAGGLGQFSTLSVGVLVLLLGIGLPMWGADGREAPAVRGIAAIVAAGQLALLVATGDFAPLSWGLYGLLSVAFVWLTFRVPALRPVLAVPLLTALLLAGLWPKPDLALFSVVMVGILIIYGGAAAWRLWRPGGGLLEATSIAITALGSQLLSLWHFHVGGPGQDVRFALLAMALALVPALAAGLGWRNAERRDDFRFTLLASAAGALLVIAAALGLPGWSLPVGISLIAAALLAIAIRAQDTRLANGARAFLAGAVVALFATGTSDVELARFIAAEPNAQAAKAILRWSVLALTAAFFAWRYIGTKSGMALQAMTVVLGYGLAAQIIPAPWLSLAASALLLALVEGAKHRATLLLPAFVTSAAIVVLWAMVPFVHWLVPALASLWAEPMLVSELPGPGEAIRLLLAPAVIMGVALWRLREGLPRRAWTLGMAQIGALALIGVHLAYKQIFMITTIDAFIRHGLVERTFWQAGLIAIGVAVWRISRHRFIALAFVGVALAHNLVYSLLLHNPLWSAQAVDALPLANLLLPAFAIAFSVPLLIMRIVPAHTQRLRRPTAILQMVAILLFAYASLRQLFAGTVLVGSPIGPTENIGWSVLAILLAIGFLVWGIRQGLRDWRTGSLLLMLTAVGKVFLFDAAGLDGLLRIASFLALGFSLIGIGWLYSRYLKPGGGESASAGLDDAASR